jgi:hypothetical protein
MNKDTVRSIFCNLLVKARIVKITLLVPLVALLLISSCSTFSRYGYIDKSGHEVIRGAFDNTGNFSEGLARVEIDKKYGFIDRSGKIVISPQFSYAEDFKEGLAVVVTKNADTVANNYGYIDKSGKLVIKPVFSSACNFSEGLAYALIITTPNKSSDWKYGFIDRTGKFVIRTDGDVGTPGNFKEGLAPVIKMPAHKWGYIDKSGNFIIKPQFDEAYDFSNGFAKVVVNGSTGYIDHKGQFIVKAVYEVVDQHRGNFSEGMAAVKKERKWGYITSIGKGVKKEHKWGYIDSTGKEVISPQFTEAGDFAEGLAIVNVGAYWHPATGLDNIKGYYGGGNTWVINKAGTKVVLEGEPFIQDGRFSEGLLPVRIDKAFGYMDKTGKVAIAPQWDFVRDFHEGLAVVHCKVK